MKIGVMSDTHLGRVSDLLKKVVEQVFSDADMILHAGDIVSGEVFNYLETMGVIAVRGNMDWSDLTSLPAKRVLKAGRFTLGLIHGWGPATGLRERVRPEFDLIDCLVFGHSHEACNQVVDGELYFNPGSVSDPRGRGSASVGWLHIGEDIRGEIVTIA